LQDLGVDEMMISKWMFKKWDGEEWIGSIWSRIGYVRGACECLNEPSVSIKCREFLEWLGTF